jgi:hypothetical protein
VYDPHGTQPHASILNFQPDNLLSARESPGSGLEWISINSVFNKAKLETNTKGENQAGISKKGR